MTDILPAETPPESHPKRNPVKTLFAWLSSKRNVELAAFGPSHSSPAVRNTKAFSHKGPRSLTDHATDAYEALVTKKLAENPTDHKLALAQCIGSIDMQTFVSQGNGHVAALRYYGLEDGMSIYDLGCGCGRTAQALQRSGWHGTYKGADIISRLVDELRNTCPDFEAVVHNDLSIDAADNSLNMVFHWSVFTHLLPEQCFVYMHDIHRALKPGGKHIFSFLELEAPQQMRVFDSRVSSFASGAPLDHLDTFLHRDWICAWAKRLGFSEPVFTGGEDATHHEPFWQTIAIMEKL